MEFVKMHGAGNDYVFVDCFCQTVANPQELAVAISKRHFGIGADGLVLILPSDKADCRMRMFNADGSEGKMCGNAIRCVGKYFFENIDSSKLSISVETESGIKALDLTEVDGVVALVSVDMGRADFLTKNVPFITDSDEFVDLPLSAGDREFKATVVSVGNPHCVIFVDDIDKFDVAKYGALVENSSNFPERVNTEFVQFVGERTIRMRVWERGSGETLACGTGACASVAAAVRNGILPADTEITVELLGGKLFVTCRSDYELIMKGNAVEVFRGNYKNPIV